MYHDSTFPPPDDRLAGLMREFNALDKCSAAAIVDAMIACLDARDGDSDLEGYADDDLSADDVGDIAWLETDGGRAVAMHTCGEEDAEPEDISQIHRQRARIRRTRCTHRPRARVEWPLIDGANLPLGRMAFSR